MRRVRAIFRWLTVVGLALAVAGAIIAAFLGAGLSGRLASSRPAAILTMLGALVLLGGFVAWRSMLRSPGLALSHLGAVLVLVGGLWGSPQGQALRNHLRGQTHHLEGYVPLPLEHLQTWRVESLGQITKGGSLVPVEQLDFVLQPRQARVEYYPPASAAWRMEAAVYDDAGQPAHTQVLGGLPGDITAFESAGVSVEVLATSDNPPIIQLKLARGDVEVVGAVMHDRGPYQRLSLAAVYPSDAAWQAAGRPDILLAPPLGPVKDYLLDLEAIDCDGNSLARKWIEVNHPLHAGGFHIYLQEYNQQDGYILLYLRRSDGLWMVWAGFAAGLAGLVVRLWVEPIVRARRQGGRR
jgi:hypothetical protein